MLFFFFKPSLLEIGLFSVSTVGLMLPCVTYSWLGVQHNSLGNVCMFKDQMHSYKKRGGSDFTHFIHEALILPVL